MLIRKIFKYLPLLIIFYSLSHTNQTEFEKNYGIKYLNHLEIEDLNFDKTNIDIYRDKNKERRYTKKIKQNHMIPCNIKYISPEIGYGLFTARTIKNGEMIGEYTGILREWSKDTDGIYSWEYPPDDKYVIDSKQSGNQLRFVNHSYNPNVDCISVIIDDICHLIYVANQTIKKDHQILVNYGKFYWENEKPVELN